MGQDGSGEKTGSRRVGMVKREAEMGERSKDKRKLPSHTWDTSKMR